MKNNKPVYVTKTSLPPFDEYVKYVERIWDTGQLTNLGPLNAEFEESVASYLKIERPIFVQNGTLALQLALKALCPEPGEIITTPFTYVATTSAILWEGFTPVYADIDTKSLCIDPDKIEELITEKTRAILPVHVFGNICDTAKIERIAKKHNLKVIYDAAHVFGVEYQGRSALEYGDASICSFHATKLFHTIEGGLIVCGNEETYKKMELMRRFGHTGDDHFMLGINAKASEFQAAMGLVNLKYVTGLIEERKKICDLYDTLLSGSTIKPIRFRSDIKNNYGYYPVLFESEEKLELAFERLAVQQVFPRRYFYPSLNNLPYVAHQSCPVSEDIASRIACLPLYPGLEPEMIKKICREILK